jgi:hypothetical protein
VEEAMNEYSGEPGFEHGEVPAVGVLLANLGTPEAPTAAALRPYLRQLSRAVTGVLECLEGFL